MATAAIKDFLGEQHKQNGYMESVTKPPFDKLLSFTRLFDIKMQIAIMAVINKVRDNAVVIAA